MYQHVVDTLKDLYNTLAGNQQEEHIPEIGMSWYIMHHRQYPHYARGYSEGIARIKITDVTDDHVEILDNIYFKTIARDEWNEYHDQNLRRARAASHTPGKGSYVPTYLGIEHVDQAQIHSLKHGRRGPRPGY